MMEFLREPVNLFRQYRKSINPPYVRKDVTTILATLFILIVIPFTVFIAMQRFNLVSKAAVWSPTPGTTWQWQLTGTIDTSYNVQMYDIDLFDAPQSTINQLKASGRKVICYFSAGSYENWRPDAGTFPASVKGKGNGWPGENWLDIRQTSILGPIMGARMDLAVQKGCDGLEPDNVDGYSNNTGFPLTASDQITYNRSLATAAHARNLSVGLKNDIEQVPQLVGNFDWALNEECFRYSECDNLSQFISAGKAVFQVEYNLDTSSFCPQANALKFSSMKKNLDLDAWMEPCWSTSSDTTPPVRTNGSPSGALAAGTTQTTLSLSTDEAATCKYATSAGVNYSSMPNTFSTTGGTGHSTTVTGLTDGGSYKYYVRCQDKAAPTPNANTDDYLISFTVNASPTCTRANPTVSLSPASQSGAAGSSLSYTFSVTNNDSSACSSSTFSLSRTVPSGWSGSLSATSLTLAPGAEDHSTLFNVTSSATATPGSNNVTATATSGSYTTTATATDVVTGSTKTGDLNGDNKVDILDLSFLITRWGSSDATADLNKNGKVDVFDLSILLSNWGT